MKKNFPLILLSAIALMSLVWIIPVGAQSTAGSNDELLPLVQAISAQQKLIDENQLNIDKSLAVVQENVRQAKIYISRAGGMGKSK